MPITKSDDGIFMLSYGKEHPVVLSMWDVVENKEGMKLFDELFPESWIVRLYYRLPNGEAQLAAFTKSHPTEEGLSKAMSEGIEVIDADNPIVQKAVAAFIANGCAEKTE